MTTIQRKRKRERFHPPRAPTYFFIGRQDHPPYAWAYDDDEMRTSNIMWIIEEVIDDKDLEKVYLEEIASAKARGARMSRGEVKGGRKRRKGLAGGIIDLSISDSNGDEDHADSVLDVRSQLKSSLSNTEDQSICPLPLPPIPLFPPLGLAHANIHRRRDPSRSRPLMERWCQS